MKKYHPLPTTLTIKESKIHGLGIFALDKITKGTNLGMIHYPSKDGNIIRTPLGGFGNHSNEPNCKKLKDSSESGVYLETSKDIFPNEEITWRYTLYRVDDKMTNYDKDEERRQYDPQMRYVEKLGLDPEGEQSFGNAKFVEELKDYHNRQFDDITKPEHYCAGFQIEPLDYILKNGLDFLEGNIIKYISRYDMKGGVKDLNKAKFYLDKLIERETQKNES